MTESLDPPSLHRAPNQFTRGLFRDLPRRYDLLGNVLSFGQDRQWRAATVRRAVTEPGTAARTAEHRVLDVATGTAGIALALADATPAGIVGVDLTEQMLVHGARNVATAGRRDRVVLAGARAEELPFPDATFDAVTFSYLLRYVADIPATMRELARVLKPGGSMASLDFLVPPKARYRAVWELYTRALLPLGCAVGGRAWFRVGRFLGPNITAHYRRHPVSAIVSAWESAGMVDVEATPMSFGAGLVMSGRKTETP